MDIGAASEAVGAVSNLIGTVSNIGAGKRQYKRQRKLMNLQQTHQLELNENQRQNAMRMWNDTNAEAQVKHYQDAGLNVGLMYEGGGGSGATTGGASAGSAGGGNAQAPMMSDGMGIQLASAMASIDLMKAQAEKARAEAENASGAGRENIQADTAVKEMQVANAKIQNDIGNRTIEAVISEVEANANIALSKARSEDVNADVNVATREERISKIEAEARNEAFKLTLMKADASLTNERARAVSVELAQEWERLCIEVDKVGVSKMQNAINEFTAKTNAKLGTGNLEMRKIEAGIEATGKILGARSRTTTTKTQGDRGYSETKTTTN